MAFPGLTRKMSAGLDLSLARISGIGKLCRFWGLQLQISTSEIYHSSKCLPFCCCLLARGFFAGTGEIKTVCRYNEGGNAFNSLWGAKNGD